MTAKPTSGQLVKKDRNRNSNGTATYAVVSGDRVSNVALALLERRDTSPKEAMRRTRDAMLADPKCLDWDSDYSFDGLLCHDEVLVASFRFEGGGYGHGRLWIDGSFPHTIETAALGRPLGDFVDHPALVASGAKVAFTSRWQNSLHLYHEPRLMTIEEAERRWTALRGGD